MKIKTNELTGAALDWAVAKAIGEYKPVAVPSYSTDWAPGGPIIDREGIEFRASGTQASIVDGRTYYGPTHLIAAMRCYVASKLGDEVDVPEALA
jgi:hypothetical protein